MSNMINWPARFAEMVDFVGLSEEDRQLIKASAPIILALAGHLNDFVMTNSYNTRRRGSFRHRQ